MKTLYNIILSIILLFIGTGDLLSQTFTVSQQHDISNTNAWTLNIPVNSLPAGKVLKEVHLDFGRRPYPYCCDDYYKYCGDLALATVTLKNPSNQSCVLMNPSNFTSTTDESRRTFNIRLRDLSGLMTPGQWVTATGNTISNAYPFNYGFWKPVGSYANFTTTNNGTWKLTIQYASASGVDYNTYKRRFNSVSLIFADSYTEEEEVTVIDIDGPNDACSKQFCVETGRVYHATNSGFPNNQSVFPPLTINGCQWNSDKNNAAWFYFTAEGTTANISISGLTTKTQSVVLKTENCGTGGYTLVAGGCPTNMFASGEATMPQYNHHHYDGGTSVNHGYNLTGLTPGHEYIIVVDGVGNGNNYGGSQTNFFLEVETGAAANCIYLPVELISFTGKHTEKGNVLTWITGSEKNNDYFLLEFSIDGENFNSVATVKGAGFSDNEIEYEYIDRHPANVETIYYRIKQVDYNGRYEYHPTISIKRVIDKNNLIVSPNPAEEKVNVELNVNQKGVYSFEFTAVSGQKHIQSYTLVKGYNRVEIELNNKFSSGFYILKVYNQEQKVVGSQKFIKQ